LVRDKPSLREIKHKTLSADLIYAGGGGNTLSMMKIWRRSGFADVIGDAAKRNIVLSGLCAGALCWFRYGNSGYRRKNAPKNSGTRIKGLGLVNATFSPHHMQEGEYRMNNLKKIMERTSGVGLAVDDFAAIEINGDQFRILKSKRHATVKRVYHSRGKIIIERVTASREPRPLTELIERPN